MIIADAEVLEVTQPAQSVFTLSFSSPNIASGTLPGQFVNVLVRSGTDPLLRRPFSVYRIEGNTVQLIFNVVGKGTSILASKRRGDTINVLGPLGRPFSLEGKFTRALLLAGGLGVAPMPILTSALAAAGKQVETFLGARTRSLFVAAHLQNVHYATDDGSRGFHGTVVHLAEEYLNEHPPGDAKIFACGPTAMLRAVCGFAARTGIDCEVSLEGDMGCGIGICQGCPVEQTGRSRAYALVCVDGPAFDSRRIILH